MKPTKLYDNNIIKVIQIKTVMKRTNLILKIISNLTLSNYKKIK